MYFLTLSDFIAMGGHGFYVWMAFLFAIFGMSFLLISPLISKRRALDSIRQQMKIDR